MDSILKLITKYNKYAKFTKGELVQLLTMIEANRKDNFNFYIESIIFTRTNEYKLSQEVAKIFIPENYNKIMEIIENPKIVYLGNRSALGEFLKNIDCPNIGKLLKFTECRNFNNYYNYYTDECNILADFKFAFYSEKYISANSIYIEFKLEYQLWSEFRDYGIVWDIVEKIPSVKLDRSKLTEEELEYYDYLRSVVE